MKQVSVFIENTSGTLTGVLETLKEAGIQMISLSIADTAEYGICRIICDAPQKAYTALQAAGFAASVSDVIAVGIGDEPGDAADMVALFSAAGVSIAYLYSFLLAGRPVLAFRTDDTARAIDIIANNGLALIETI